MLRKRCAKRASLLVCFTVAVLSFGEIESSVHGQGDAPSPVYLPLIIGGEAGTAGPLIQDVVVDKPQVCPGEDLLVMARTIDPGDAEESVDVWINGQTGHTQYLQFTGLPGPRVIEVTAALRGQIARAQATVEVVACDAGRQFPVITARPNPYQHLTVDLDIANAQAFADQSPTYIWDFGDGQSTQTTVPVVSHFYGDALDRDTLYSVFQAQVTVRRSGQDDVAAHTTITIQNMYAFNKQRGFIQPPVEPHTPEVRLAQDTFSAAYTITNLEDQPLRLTSRWLEYQHCDPDKHATRRAPENVSIDIGGGQDLAQQLDLPAQQVPNDVCGLAVYHTGSMPDGLKVYAGVYFAVRDNPLMQERVQDAALRQVLNQVVAEGLVTDPTRITEADLYRLAREGKIAYPPAPDTASADTAPQQVGEVCSPDDPPRNGFTCQATGEWTINEPHIANARKGDSILSPGCGSGLIGNLLQQVIPPQKFSHTGIMTRDYYELRHSTASTQRFEDYLVGFEGSDGVRSDVLRYGWPGVITQSVDEAFNGQQRRDPVNDRYYTIKAFSADPALCANGDIVYPVVLKPAPDAELAVRDRLHAAADAAQEIQGHYRFFAYTDAAIVTDSRYAAPPEVAWAGGSPATTCSSFIWHAFKQAGIELEGADLEPADVLQLAMRDDATPDGLYLYTAAERSRAGDWLYNEVYSKAYERAGWFGNLVTDAADNFGNQLANCFAADGCDTDAKDSERWRNPGYGRTVSPDDMLFWDIYGGYTEPLFYRGAEHQPVYHWQISDGYGNISVRVLNGGNAVRGARVKLHAHGFNDRDYPTDRAGTVRFEGVPAGRYLVEAYTPVNGLRYTARRFVDIRSGATGSVTLNLQPPPEVYRQVRIRGDMRIVDDENWPDSDEVGTFDIFKTARLDPWTRRAKLQVKECVGGEVRVEIDFNLQLLSDNTSVAVTGEARLYEGTSCRTNDREDRESFEARVAADASTSRTIALRNRGAGGGDKADISFTITNWRQP